MSSDMETVTIAKTQTGYELSDSSGGVLSIYESWEPIEAMFRSEDYSVEYISKRKREVDRRGESIIDETQ
jgi:hypothetical protein